MVTESWERLITNKHAQTTTSLSLILHRITGRKEATTLLHRLGVGIFYNDVRLITSYWDSCIKSHRYASSWVFIQLTYSHNI